MSTRKPTIPPRFGDVPAAGGAAGERRPAPLPLMTQPMIRLDQDGSPAQTLPGMRAAPASEPVREPPAFSGRGGAGATQSMIEPDMSTRIDNPQMAPQIAVFGRPTALVAPIKAPNGYQPQSTPRTQHPDLPPPDINLTQHHLPDGPPDSRLALVIDPDSERSASFRVLRHHLLEVGRPQVVVVSSPLAGDGKTTVAMNLALALAECGRAKVLLAEANVRRPALAEALRLVPPWCFAEQLAAHRHQPQLPWSLVEIPQMWLHVAAISPRIEKTQLLDAPAFAIAMERLRVAGYEHIVIDAPAILGSADVNLMSDAADAVLLVASARRTTARDLRKSVDQLGASKVIGSVLVE